ncbi:MAG: hypothetical protein MJA83_02730 [Gammaproteobacteria bacterium]|nr:hypothetical protein [Gammaproteobacteria bacterium]
MPQSIRDLADLAILELETSGPKPSGWNIRKTGNKEYRLRLNYRYRMRYRVTEDQIMEIEVFYLGHRREAYR